MLKNGMAEGILKTILEKGLEGPGVTASEAREFIGIGDERIYDALHVVDRITRAHKGREINLCAIVNAKSGLCKEDCSFCAQSVKYPTGVEEYPLTKAGVIVNAAKDAAENGAGEFSIVASGTRMEKESDVAVLTEALKAMKASAPVERCASLGIMKRDTLKRLKDAGLQSYHHNLETSRSFFPKVCTTHAYEEDVQAIRDAKGIGLYVCSGGIFGLGESWEDRIELAMTLRGLGVDSIPINFLNPRPGTPLEGARFLTPMECLRIISLFRIILPEKDIVVCGGRHVNLRDLQPLIFAAGANGMMIGNYLTTPGRDPSDDLRMIRDLGLRPRRHED